MKAKFSWRNTRCRRQMVSKISCVILLLVTVSIANAAEVEDFMPRESVFYIKLQDIDEVYSEIEISENWGKSTRAIDRYAERARDAARNYDVPRHAWD